MGYFYLSHSGGSNWGFYILDGTNTRQVSKNGTPGNIVYNSDQSWYEINAANYYSGIMYVGVRKVKLLFTIPT